ncbi:MAG: YHS domain-containing protein [Candidatus Ratteibacteria bacterium]
MKKLIISAFFFTFLSGLAFSQSCCAITGPSEKCDFLKIGNEMICPVTKEKFQANEKSEKSEYKGKIYIFCCPMCKGKFEKEPEKYIKGK